ncbi:MAG: hypothetical protein KJ601_00095 [Nanoarchaeota archaeon]|nr:hypothetical protein [Nanoarchaeota archaeon]MBU1703859.1 hypothetical protein [Nanoarchaeota archaeon]
MKIISEKPVTMAYVRKELENIKKRDKELSFRSGKTEEYLNQFADKNSKELQDKLTNLDIPRLKEEHIVKIVDIRPINEKDLKGILSNYPMTITNDNLKKIIQAIKE